MMINHLMLRLQSMSFRECGVFLDCHYSKVHSDPEQSYLLIIYYTGNRLAVYKLILNME